mgnify:CR=1 FL=1
MWACQTENVLSRRSIGTERIASCENGVRVGGMGSWLFGKGETLLRLMQDFSMMSRACFSVVRPVLLSICCISQLTSPLSKGETNRASAVLVLVAHTSPCTASSHITLHCIAAAAAQHRSSVTGFGRWACIASYDYSNKATVPSLMCQLQLACPLRKPTHAVEVCCCYSQRGKLEAAATPLLSMP